MDLSKVKSSLLCTEWTPSQPRMHAVTLSQKWGTSFLLCLCVWPACMQCLQIPEEGIGSVGTRVTGSCETVVLGIDPRPLEEQLVLLAAVQFVQPPSMFLHGLFYFSIFQNLFEVLIS